MAEVEIRVRAWTGDHETEEGEEPAILYCDVISIDGFALPVRGGEPPARVSFGTGDFVQLEVEDPSDELRARYADPESYLMGTDESRLLLPVTKLTVTGA